MGFGRSATHTSGCVLTLMSGMTTLQSLQYVRFSSIQNDAGGNSPRARCIVDMCLCSACLGLDPSYGGHVLVQRGHFISVAEHVSKGA